MYDYYPVYMTSMDYKIIIGMLTVVVAILLKVKVDK